MRRSLGPAFNPDRRACSLLTDCVAVDTGVILKGKNDLSVHKSWKFSHDLEQFCTGQKSIFTKILTLDSHTIFFWPTFQNKQLWSYFGSFSLRYLLPVNGVEGARLLVWKQKLESWLISQEKFIEILEMTAGVWCIHTQPKEGEHQNFLKL